MALNADDGVVVFVFLETFIYSLIVGHSESSISEEIKSILFLLHWRSNLLAFSFLSFCHDTVTFLFYLNILDIIYGLLVNHLVLFCMHLI